MQKIIISNRISLPNCKIRKSVKKLFTILNPDYLQICLRKQLKKKDWPDDYILKRSQTDGRWTTEKIPKWIVYWRRKGISLTVPRGSLFALKKLFKQHGLKYKVVDKRKSIPNPGPAFKFHGELDPDRDQLRIKKLKFKTGIFKAPTGSGKTVMTNWVIAQRNCMTLILVDTERLTAQWIREVKLFLHLKEEEIGFIGEGQEKIRPVTIGLIQSVYRKPHLLKHFGFLIIDECPSVATETFGLCVDNFFGEYILGLSATPKRSDGKTVVMKWYLGEVKLKIRYKDAKRTPGKVYFVGTDYEKTKGSKSFRSNPAGAMGDLTEDKERNKLIQKVMVEQKDFPGCHIVLSHRVDHLVEIISSLPETMRQKCAILVSQNKKAERAQIVKDVQTGKIKYLFATHRMLGRGFDEGSLSILYLVTPFKNVDNLKQYIGRVSRLYPGKIYFMIFDFFDRYHTEIRPGGGIRSKLYKKLGIEKNLWR